MKNINRIKQLLLGLAMLLVTSSYAQFVSTPSTFGEFGSTDTPYRGIGIGPFPSGVITDAALHVNTNYMSVSSNYPGIDFGEVFWTDCAEDMATYWRLLRGNTHYGWLWNNSRDEDANDFSMGSPSGSLLFHTLEGTNSGVTSTMIPHFKISNSDVGGVGTPTFITTASMERVEVTPDVLGSASAIGFGGVLQNPRLLVVGGNDDGTTEPVAEFRSIAENTSSVGIKIRGSRHGAIKSNCAFIDFANYIDEDNTEYPLARISSDQRNYSNFSGYLRMFTTDNLTGTSGLIQKLMIDFNGYTGIGYNLFDADNQPNRRLESYEEGNDDIHLPQLRLTSVYDTDVSLGTFTDFETNSLGGHANLYIHPSSDVSSPGSPVEGMVGINIEQANNTLEIFSTVLSPRPAGLRFSNINSSSFDISPNGKVLTVDPNGDVCITLGGTGSVSLANNGLSLDPGSSFSVVQLGHELGIGSSSAILLHDSEIPFDNFNLVFTDPSSNIIGAQNSIGIGTISPSAKLDVKRSYSNASLINFPIAIKGVSSDLGDDPWTSIDKNFGIWGEAVIDNPSIGHNELNVGGFFKASDAVDNIGVWGYTDATTNSPLNDKNYGGNFEAYNANTNYAVYATVGTNCAQISGCNDWAGYFVGSTYSTGTYLGSDINLKTNVNDINGAKNIINSLVPKSFYFDPNKADHLNLPDGIHYGFIAQNVDTVLPNCVRQTLQPAKYDDQGTLIYPDYNFKSVNYIELIPILTMVVKEQQQVIDSLITALQGQPKQNNLNQSDPENNSVNELKVSLSNSKVVYLSQNLPNPFDDNTTITFSIPVEVKTAQIIFTENNGVVLKSMDITQRGESSLTVFGENLSKGIYSYSLIIDGKVFETKKMVKQ